jgi:hypothetical protein
MPTAPGRFLPAASGSSVVPLYSRWRGDPTSLGPVGRIGWTLAVLLVAAFAAVSGDIFFIGIWWLLAGPLVLRSVWRKARIR